jgi:hypothetical protein
VHELILHMWDNYLKELRHNFAVCLLHFLQYFFSDFGI